MKNMIPALVLLSALLGLCLQTGTAVAGETQSRRQELEQTEVLIREARWRDAQSALERSYRFWTRQQPFLRVILPHSSLEDVECLYRRVIAFTSVQDSGELLADLSALIRQLELLSIREQPSLSNIL